MAWRTVSPLRNRRPDGTNNPETTIVSARLTPAELAALDPLDPRLIARADIGMTRFKLTDQFAENEVELATMSEMARRPPGLRSFSAASRPSSNSPSSRLMKMRIA
mgnify:CR=1 FL=1